MSDESGSDGSVNNEDESMGFLDMIERAEEYLKDLKEHVLQNGGNDLFADACEVSRQALPIADLMHKMHMKSLVMSDGVGRHILNNLVHYGDPALPPETWEEIHDILEDVEVAGDDFKRTFSHIETESNRNSLLHEVCKCNPPVEVVKTLLDIIPKKEEESNIVLWNDRTYNHIHQNDEGEVPLNLVIKNGGSFELVKLLVDTHGGDKSLGFSRGTSLLHQLVSNRANHESNDFSDSLRLLVKAGNNYMGSPLLHQDDEHKKLPLELLWQSLQLREVTSNFDIVQQKDFQLLLKATSVLYQCTRHTRDRDEMMRKIDSFSLLEAWIACSGCFESSVVKDVLKKLIPSNEKFFLEKHEDGKYFIHKLLDQRGCFVKSSSWSLIRDIVETILAAVPQAARLANNEGLLPLHVIADSTSRNIHISDAERLELVRTIWKAYPEAVEVMDKQSSIAPFLLPLRDERDKTKEEKWTWFETQHLPSLSTAFFLLQQRPEMIHRAVLGDLGGQNEKEEPNATTVNPSKRMKV